MKKLPIKYHLVTFLRPMKNRGKVEKNGRNAYYYVVHSTRIVIGARNSKDAISKAKSCIDGLVADKRQEKVMNDWKRIAKKHNLKYADKLTKKNYWQFACDEINTPDGVVRVW